MKFKVGDRVKLRAEEVKSVGVIIDDRLGESPYYIVSRVEDRFYNDESRDDEGEVLYIHTPKNHVIEMAWYAYRFELYMRPVKLPEGLFEL